MNIYGTNYDVNKETLEIYLSGCKVRCEGCHNKHTWNFDLGKHWTEYKENITQNIKFGVKKIWILGGEPLNQDLNQLFKFIEYLKTFKLELWLFTSFNMFELSREIIEKFSYIKCGNYDNTKLVDNYYQYGIKLASSNQHIIKGGLTY